MNALILSLAIISFTADPPDLDRLVTINHKGAPLSRLLSELGTEQEVEFTVAPEVRNEVIVVSVKDVPLRDVLERIAQASTSKWSLNGSRIDFHFDSQRAKEQANILYQNRLKRIQQARADFLKGTSPQKIEVEKGVFETYEPERSTLILSQLIRPISDAQLAQINKGERVVFSTRPTRMQRPMGTVNSALIQQWIQEHNENVAEQLRELEEQKKNPEMAEYLKYMENMPRPKLVTTSPAKILLVASAKGDFGNTSFSVIVYDQKGDEILREQMGFHIYVPCAYDSKETSRAVEGTDQSEGDGHSHHGDERLQAKLVVDERVKRIISSIEAGFETGQIDLTVQDEAIQIGTRPDLYEPISLITGEGIAQISSALGKNIVACVPDRFGDWFYGVPESLQELYSDLQEESFAEDDKWIVVTPKDPIYSRQVRIERNSLATLLTTVSNTGHISLDELANFFASNDRRAMESTLFSSLARAFAPSIFGGMLFGMETQPTFLRLFGLLSPGQRSALRSGRQVAFGTLSPAAREELNYVLFGIQNSLEVFSPEKPLKRPTLDEMLGQGMMFLEEQTAGGDYRTEPTEIMPTGLPAQGFLQADVSLSSYAMPLGRNGKANFASMSMSSLELAFIRAMMDVPEVMAEAAQFVEIFNNMAVGQRTNLYIGAHVATGVAQTSELNDNGKPGTQRYSIGKLPEPLESEVAAMVKEVKASQMFQFFGGMGSSPPIKP